jgi:glycosyltransferase involved in cell wall biosynthesis
MFSVVVPAHDEEAVIGRCLRAITQGAAAGELEVIVVCNGCSDRTAERARAFGPPVRVLETPRASKAEALDLGDAEARGFPRFYLDADVVLPLESARRVADVLRGGPVLAAAPRLRVDLAETPWAVRAYYAVWTRLPYVAQGMIGSGVYAVSAAGRARFGRFPAIISDDGFVRLQFAPGERASVEGAWFEISPPRSLRELIRIKVRSQKGAIQLARRFPELLRNEDRDYGASFGDLLRHASLWPSMLVYAAVRFTARARAFWQVHAGGLERWERDDSSRVAARRGELGGEGRP